ncbi:MAG: YdeI/OmpD-associated family protein [Acidimicrobiia bacterium]|nr:YdeI/OmpD-associated family protein [Acidimicrobiia bacterium]
MAAKDVDRAGRGRPGSPAPRLLDVRSPSAWEEWLEENHETVQEGVWLRLFRKGDSSSTLDYSQAVDVALCFGWIDGQAKKYDAVSRVQRFTPRRSRSMWSKVNTERAEHLSKAGRLRPAGQRAVEDAKRTGRWEQAYDPPSKASIPEDFLAELAKNEKAAAFFATLNKRNTYSVAYRLQTARSPETRARRIKTFVEMFERGEKLYG